MAHEPDRKQLMDHARTLRTIIDYQKWREDAPQFVEDIHRPGNPLEFLCLSVGGSPHAFPDLFEADHWVKQYRAGEAKWLHESPNVERAGLPIGILVAANQPPSDLDAWRKDCEVRESLGTQGAMLLDRPEVHAGTVDKDDDLFLETIAAAIANPGFIASKQTGDKFDSTWKPSDPVGPLGAEYGRQPPSADSPDNDKYFAKRFDAYTSGSPDLNF